MPRDFITADTGFPNLTGNETVEEKVDRLYDYTFMLLESLRYVLRNLDADNFNTAAVDEFRKAYKDNAVEALAAFKAEANDTYAKAEMLTKFKEEMNNSFSEFKTEANANYATTIMFSTFESKQNDEFNAFKKEQQDAYDSFTQTQTEALASVQTQAGKNASSIKALAEWQTDFLKEGGDFESVLSRVSNLETAADTYALKTSVTSFEKIQETANEAANNAENNVKTYADNLINVLETDFTRSITAVTQRANAAGAFIDLITQAGNGNLKVNSDGSFEIDENGEYIYVDKNGEELPLSQADIAGIFISTLNDGSSEIKLKADKILFGENSSVDNAGNLKISRLWDSQSYENYYAKMYSSYGDFGIYEKSANDTDNPLSENCVWGVYNALDAVSFYCYGEKYIEYNRNSKKVYPKGVWDFLSCTVQNLGVVPVFA